MSRCLPARHGSMSVMVRGQPFATLGSTWKGCPLFSIVLDARNLDDSIDEAGLKD